jgi:hypothetical protein
MKSAMLALKLLAKTATTTMTMEVEQEETKYCVCCGRELLDWEAEVCHWCISEVID